MSLLRALRGREKFTGRHLLITGALVVLFFLFTAWSVGYTSKSEFCGSCHEMGSFYQTWNTSAHKSVDCIDCHSEPGVQGLIKVKVKGLKELYVHMTSSNINPKAHENDINCYNCHQGKVSTNVDQALSRATPHTVKHIQNGLTCLTCHSGLVHNAKTNNLVPSRDTCVTCHLDQMYK